jgi:hypothetical protein
MNPEEIKQLLEKYYSGETSPAEEIILKEFFFRSNIPGELEPEKEIFSYYFNLSGIPAPSDDFEKRIFGAVDDAEQEITDLSRRKLFRYLTGIAAGLLILTASYFFLSRSRMPADTFSDPELAYNEAMKILYDVSNRMNTGTHILKKVGMMQHAADEGFKILHEPAVIAGEKMKPLYLLNNVHSALENEENRNSIKH